MKKLLTLLLCVFLYVPSLSFFFDTNKFEDLYFPNISQEYTVQDLFDASLSDIKVNNKSGNTVVTGVYNGRAVTFVTDGNTIHASVNGDIKNDIWLESFIQAGYDNIRNKVRYPYIENVSGEAFVVLQGFPYTINQSYANVTKKGKVEYKNIDYKKSYKDSTVLILAVPTRNRGQMFKPAVIEYENSNLGNIVVTIYNSNGDGICAFEYKDIYRISVDTNVLRIYTMAQEWDQFDYTSADGVEYTPDYNHGDAY